MIQTDVVILGAGAAGLMCAIEASKRGRRVVVLERNREIGAKIRISGGGKCNFTNRSVTADNYLSNNPHFSTSALSRFTSQDFLQMIESHNIAYSERDHGQLFCRDSAIQIIDMLTNECRSRGVSIITGCQIGDIAKGTSFIVSTKTEEFQSENLVVATGGLSVPTLGATDAGFRIAKNFGMEIVTPRPALAPLVFGSSEATIFSNLSGISAIAEVTCKRTTFCEAVLITHRGLSGPAILQISSYWREGDALSVNFFPGIDVMSILIEGSQGKKKLSTLLSHIVSARLAFAIEERIGGPFELSKCTEKELFEIDNRIRHMEFLPIGTEGFKKAEATLGGVDTSMLSSKTLESKTMKGLYFIGEVVDVTGWLGGYNLQWAWSSGWAAGQYC
jgi:predicted Rossmann fold flavoprotein